MIGPRSAAANRHSALSSAPLSWLVDSHRTPPPRLEATRSHDPGLPCSHCHLDPPRSPARDIRAGRRSLPRCTASLPTTHHGPVHAGLPWSTSWKHIQSRPRSEEQTRMLSHVILTARATPRCPTADARLPTRGPGVRPILLSNPRPRKYPFGWHRDGQSCRCRCVWRHTFGTRRWRSVTRSRGIIDVVGGDESGDDVRGRWVAPHSLTHGVCMVLCAEHRSDEFQCLREGTCSRVNSRG